MLFLASLQFISFLQPSPDNFEESEPRSLKRTRQSSRYSTKIDDHTALEEEAFRERCRWLLPEGIDMMEARQARMEEVQRETEEIAKRHERENTWFDLEYLAFIERGTFFLSA